MKKDLIFAPILSLVAVVLFLLRFTGMSAHIAVSVVGAIVLVAYTVLTKKEWRIPALEIATRACYGVALITGVIIMKAHGIKLLGILHKMGATLFLIGIVALLVTKLLAKKKT